MSTLINGDSDQHDWRKQSSFSGPSPSSPSPRTDEEIEREIARRVELGLSQKKSPSKKPTTKLKARKSKGKSYSPRQAENEIDSSSGSDDDEDDAIDEYVVVESVSPPSVNDTPAIDDFEAVRKVLLRDGGSVFEDMDTTAQTVTFTHNDQGSFGILLDSGVDDNVFPAIKPSDAAVIVAGHIDHFSMLVKVDDVIVAGKTHKEIETIIRAGGFGDDKTTITTLVVPLPHDDAPRLIKDLLLIDAKRHRADLDGHQQTLLFQAADAVRKTVHRLTTPYTTRPPRVDEESGVEYNFIDIATFNQLKATNNLLESNMGKNGHWYGTPLVERALVDVDHHMTRINSLLVKKASREGQMTVADIARANNIDLTGVESEINLHASAKELKMLSKDAKKGSELFKLAEASKDTVYETVPYTTRQPREGEQRGREYHFITMQEFKSMIDADEFDEYGERGGTLYGTIKVEKALTGGALHGTRSLELMRVKKDREEDAKIYELMQFSNDKHTDSHKLWEHVSLPNFLHTVPPHDPYHAELRKKVKAWLYDCTVPVTTRPAREGEVDGVDYYFVSVDDFKTMVAENRFIEHGFAHGNLYGTLRVLSKDIAHDGVDHARASRSKMRQQDATMDIGAAYAKVNHINDAAAKAGLDAHHLHVPLADFFKTVPHNDPYYANARKAVKHTVYTATVPLTTRQPRMGEQAGIDYHFVTKDQFKELIANGTLLEFGEYKGDFYGTSKPTVTDLETPHPRQVRDSMACALDDGGAVELRLSDLKSLDDHEDSRTLPPNLKRLSVSRFLAHVGPTHDELAGLHTHIARAVRDMCIPYTTRPRREGEIEGVDYHFVTQETFAEMKERGVFIEVGWHRGQFYGTRKPTTNDVDPNGHPKISRRQLNKARLENVAGEATVLDLNNTFGLDLPTLPSHDTPLSQFLASVPKHDEAHADTRKKIKLAVYNSTVPFTTRNRREGERDGREYNFVDDDTFQMMVENNEFIEYNQIVATGYWYGTPLLMKKDLDSNYSRKAIITEATKNKRKHARISDILPSHAQIELAGDTTVSQFLSSTAPNHPVLADLRASVKAAIYEVTTPYTTRKMRPIEQEGVEYHFVTDARFNQLVEEDFFLEYSTDKTGVSYGTPHLLEQQLRAHVDGFAGLKRTRSSIRSNSMNDVFDKLPLARDRFLKIHEQVEEMKSLLSSKDDEGADHTDILNRLHVVAHGGQVPQVIAEEPVEEPPSEVVEPPSEVVETPIEVVEPPIAVEEQIVTVAQPLDVGAPTPVQEEPEEEKVQEVAAVDESAAHTPSNGEVGVAVEVVDKLRKQISDHEEKHQALVQHHEQEKQQLHETMSSEHAKVLDEKQRAHDTALKQKEEEHKKELEQIRLANEATATALVVLDPKEGVLAKMEKLMERVEKVEKEKAAAPPPQPTIVVQQPPPQSPQQQQPQSPSPQQQQPLATHGLPPSSPPSVLNAAQAWTQHRQPSTSALAQVGSQVSNILRVKEKIKRRKQLSGQTVSAPRDKIETPLKKKLAERRAASRPQSTTGSRTNLTENLTDVVPNSMSASTSTTTTTTPNFEANNNDDTVMESRPILSPLPLTSRQSPRMAGLIQQSEAEEDSN